MSDMLGGSFGSPIKGEPLTTIHARESFFGKARKTEKELEWIHGNTPWVMLRSGVDTPQGGTQTAKNYAMKGGTTSWPQVKGQMFGTGGSRWGGYKITNFDQGFRPEPGLMSVSAKSRDTLGMVLEATVNFRVWSLEDLEAMDQIYFKPGFPILLEWGHSMYISPSGNCVGVWEEKPFLDDSVFYTQQTFADLNEKIQERREKYPNYEAIFGLITNFSYSVQKDGSYDCSLKALSMGSVLEGLKLRTSSDFTVDNSEKQDENVDYITSVYHTILEAFQKYKWEKKTQSLPSAPGGDPKLPRHKHPAENTRALLAKDKKAGWFDGVAAWSSYDKVQAPPEELESFLVLAQKSAIKRKPLLGIFRRGSKDDMQFYVKLRDLLTIFNGVNSDNGTVLWDLNSKHRYVTCPEHISLNPGIVVLPKQASGEFAECIVPENFKCLSTQDSWNAPNNRSDQILNLWINFGGFVDIVGKNIDSEGQGFTLQNALETLLVEVQKALGNVNNFGLHYNDSYRVWSIVDRNEVMQETEESPSSLRITGLNNTVTGFNIETKITSNMANEMCILAQNPKAGSTNGENEHEKRMVFWGENCTSRFTYPNNGPNGSDGSVGEEDFNSVKKKLKFIYEALAGDQSMGNNDGSYREGAGNVYSECQLAGENYIKKMIAKHLEDGDTGEGNVPQNGLIPINANITLLGIGRFVIGSVFKLDQKLLPTKYSKSWGYVVTGISHKVDQKGWWTEVTTTGYLLNEAFSGGSLKSGGSSSSSLGSNPSTPQAPAETAEEQETMENEKSDLFLNYFKAHYVVTPEHLCARGTRCLAWGYVDGKNGIQRTKNGGSFDAESGKFASTLPPSYSSVYNATGLTKAELVSYLANNSNFKPGDVVRYYHTNYIGGPWVKSGGGAQERHAQFFVGPGHWETDRVRNYGGSFVYNSKGATRYWTIDVYRTSAPMHSDWKGIGSR